MNKLIEVQKKIIPQAIELMEKRYAILRQISISQPIGRRMLSVMLDLSERTTRTEIDFLKEQNLIDIAVSGMTITDEGREVIEMLDSVMGEVLGISDLEIRLKEKLGISNVSISKNMSESKDLIVKSVAKLASDYILKKLNKEDIIAISGGTTMKEVAQNITTTDVFSGVTVLPTRGSFGSEIELQANNIADTLAKKLGANVEFLFIPDELDENARNTMMSIPEIKNTITKMKQADKLIVSIGRADVMAKRRKLSDEALEILREGQAVGEAFGHYFDKNGKVVLKLNTMGIDMETYKNSKEAIIIFSGTEKVDAFLAISNLNKNIALITDELSANEILSKIG